MLKYETHRYDENLLLRIFPLLWLLILYGIRHPLFWSAAHLMPLEIGAIPLIDLQTNPLLIWADIPAALTLLSVGHRVKNANKLMQWIWHHGKELLLLSYLISMGIFSYLNWQLLADPERYGFFTSCLVLAGDTLAIIYLSRSELISDIFKDFPVEKPIDKGAVSN